MVERSCLGVGSELGVTSADGLTIVLADLAQSVVAAQAPEQVELLAAVTARWESGEVPGRRRWGWTGGSVGSGIEPVVLSNLIYPLLTGTLAQVLGSAAVEGWRRRWWRHRRRGSDLPSVPRVQVTLDVDQIEAVRVASVAHGMALGLSEARATILADAVHGVLCRALAKSGRQA